VIPIRGDNDTASPDQISLALSWWKLWQMDITSETLVQEIENLPEGNAETHVPTKRVYAQIVPKVQPLRKNPPNPISHIIIGIGPQNSPKTHSPDIYHTIL